MSSFDFYSLLPQINSYTPFISALQTSSSTAPVEDNIRLSTSRFRNFSSSDFIELLDALRVPFIDTLGTHFGLFGPSTWLGQGGYSTIKYDVTETDNLYQSFKNGNDASVDEASSQDSPKIVVAIKEFKDITPVSQMLEKVKWVQSMSGSAISQAYHEICIMKHPQLAVHPNILGLLGVAQYQGGLSSSSDVTLTLVIEYADLGSLETHLLRHRDEMSLQIKLQLICDIGAGLAAMHACDVVHNDVKCANILLFSESSRIVAKLADFACAIPLATSRPCCIAGATPLFSAPEAHSADCSVLPSRDVYSFGLVIYQMIIGRQPFTEVENVLEFKKSDQMFQQMSVALRAGAAPEVISHLLNEMLSVDPSERLSDISEVKNRLVGSGLCDTNSYSLDNVFNCK